MSAPSPRPRPTPGPRPAAGTGAAEVSAVPRPTRTARRQAARTQRAGRVRGVLAVVAGLVVVLAAIAVAVVVIRRGTGEPAPAATRGTTYPSTAGAVLADPTAAAAFVAGATSDIAAVTSYDYRDLDSALTTGLAVTTGAYRAAYRDALQGELGDTARKGRLVQSFELLRAGIGAMSADGRTAVVLIFGTETVTSDGGAQRSRPATLTATIVRQGSQYLISKLESGANAGLPPGSPQLAVAAEAARSQLVRMLTYSRSDFDADLQRALAGAVDPLHTAIEGEADTTRAAMRKGGYDLRGQVTAVAVERATGGTVVLLVAATGTRAGDDGTVTVVDDARVEVTAVRVGTTWTVADVQPVTG